MAAASTLRRAAAAAIHQLPAAVALLRPTTSLHAATSRRAPSLLGPNASFGQRRHFSNVVDPNASFGQRRHFSNVVDKVTEDEILKEVARIDAAGVQRHAASCDGMSDLASKVMTYREAVATKKYEKTVEVGETSFKVSFLVLVAAGCFGSAALYVMHYAGRAAMTAKAKKLVKQKAKEIKMSMEQKLTKILTEHEQGPKAGMELDMKARVAALDVWQESLLAREEALKKKEEEALKKKKEEEVGKKKEEEEVEGGNNKEVP